MYILFPAMYILFRGIEHSIFNHPLEAMMGMFMMSLGEFADTYDSFQRTEFPSVPKVNLFFLSFHFCSGERLVNRHSAVRLRLLLLYIAPCCWTFLFHFSSSAFLRSLFTQSSHLSGDLPRFLQPSCFFVSDLFGNLSSFILTMCPAHFIRLLTILPTIQALVPMSYN